jgi:hypothetical protein
MKDKISALARNAETFSDKGHQVSPVTIEAFGISLSSRYGKCGEMIEMLQFAQVAAVGAVAHYVKEVGYDSKESICAFEFDESVTEGSEIERELFGIAKKTISHFFWFDSEHFDD